MTQTQVVITGAGGLIGSYLLAYLQKQGYACSALSSHGGSRSLFGDPQKLEGYDVIIHLGAESISGLWTKKKKERIKKTRVESNKQLQQAIAQLSDKPKVVLIASAIGFYGDRQGEHVTESSDAGEGFLAEVCRELESVSSQSSVRTVYLRFGMILSNQGGMFKKIVSLCRTWLGGHFGRGDQLVNWLCLKEIGPIVETIIKTKEIKGPVNMVTPNPVAQKEFMKMIRDKLGVQALFSYPKWMVSLAPGNMAKELFFPSVYIEPTVLEKHGVPYLYPKIEQAIEDLL